MKELEQTLQRVRLVSPSGVIYRPRERVLAILKVLAAAHKNQAPYVGCSLAIPEIVRRSGKQRRTVLTALADAVTAGLLHRDRPAGSTSGEHITLISTLNPVLLEASQKEKPWAGAPLLFHCQEEPPAKQGGTITARAERAKAQHVTTRAIGKAKKNGTPMELFALLRERREREAASTQPMKKQAMKKEDMYETAGVQLLHPKYRIKTRPPAAETGGSGVSCLPPLGGGAGSGPSMSDNKSEGVKAGDRSKFFDWWSQFSEFSHFDFQSRKKDGVRGGLLSTLVRGKGQSQIAVCTESTGAAMDRLKSDLVNKMRSQRVDRVEGVVRAAEVGGRHKTIFVDDLRIEMVDELKKFWCGPGAILETSLGNFQAILIASCTLDREQRSIVQKALCTRFDGDVNSAKNPVQLHRYPGSVNWKTGEPFETSLHSLLQEVDEASARLLTESLIKDGSILIDKQVNKAAPVAAVSGIFRRGLQVATGELAGVQFNRTGDASNDAYRFAMASVRRGFDDALIEYYVEQQFNQLGKHQRFIWAKSTVAAARKFIETGVYVTGAGAAAVSK